MRMCHSGHCLAAQAYQTTIRDVRSLDVMMRAVFFVTMTTDPEVCRGPLQSVGCSVCDVGDLEDRGVIFAWV